MSQNTSNGKVTTREFYNALLEQNKERAAMENRLGDKIDTIHSEIAANNEKFKACDKRISTNTTDIKKVGSLNALATIVAATVAGIIGTNR